MLLWNLRLASNAAAPVDAPAGSASPMDTAETQAVDEAEIQAVDDDEHEPEPEALASDSAKEVDVEALPSVDSSEVLSRRMQFGVVATRKGTRSKKGKAPKIGKKKRAKKAGRRRNKLRRAASTSAGDDVECKCPAAKPKAKRAKHAAAEKHDAPDPEATAKAKATPKATAKAKATPKAAAKAKATPKAAAKAKAKAKSAPKAAAKARALANASAEEPMLEPAPKRAARASRDLQGVSPNPEMVKKLVGIMKKHGGKTYDETKLTLHHQDFLPKVRMNIYWTRDSAGVTLYTPGEAKKDVAHFGCKTNTIATNVFLARTLATRPTYAVYVVWFGLLLDVSVFAVPTVFAAEAKEVHEDNGFVSTAEGQAFVKVLKASMKAALEQYNSSEE